MTDTFLSLGSFTDKITDTMQQLLPDCQISIRQVMKPGERHLTGLCIHSGESDLAPILYLEQPYALFCHGTSIDEICKGLKEAYEQRCLMDRFDGKSLTNWNRISRKVCMKLINHKHNHIYLDDKVFRVIPDTDIACMYYISLDSVKAGAYIAVTESLFHTWDISPDVLHEAALDNTPRLHEPTVRSLTAALTEIAGEAGMPIPPMAETGAMYVVGNKENINGAVSALIPDVWKSLSEKLGPFYLLPSSTYEMIAVPQDISSPEELLKMVTEINHTQVCETEFLADDVFMISDGHLISALSEETRKAICMNALSWLKHPALELGA